MTALLVILGIIVVLAVFVIGIYNRLGMLTAALGKMFALAEAYPELKANTNFLQLQDELSDVENKIAAARRFYNNSVQEYNTGREQFPAVLIAGPFGFKEREFFEAPEGRVALQTPPEVNFD